MVLSINYSKPLAISKGSSADLMKIKVKDPLLFVSAETLKPLSRSKQ